MLSNSDLTTNIAIAVTIIITTEFNINSNNGFFIFLMTGMVKLFINILTGNPRF